MDKIRTPRYYWDKTKCLALYSNAQWVVDFFIQKELREAQGEIEYKAQQEREAYYRSNKVCKRPTLSLKG